jgi:hypothetical protein
LLDTLSVVYVLKQYLWVSVDIMDRHVIEANTRKESGREIEVEK